MAKKKKKGAYHTSRRFPERGGHGWVGPLVDYKEVELLRKFLSSSSKMMSRKRAGTSAQEQADLKAAIKHARILALLPYAGT
jgi:small subunit ribosomal protein S18